MHAHPPLFPIIALFLLASLTGCANQLPMPMREPVIATPLMLHVAQQDAKGQKLDAILIVQREDQALRWSLLNPLGAPLARQILENGDWRGDGMAPPNPLARQLFAALLFAWMPRAALDAAYGPGTWQDEPLPGGGYRRSLEKDGKPWWTLQCSDAARQTCVIDQNGGWRWTVAPLQTQP